MSKSEEDSEFVSVRHHRDCESLRTYGGGCRMGGSFSGTPGRCTCQYIEARNKHIAAEEERKKAVEQAKGRLLDKLGITEEELKLLKTLLR